MAKKKPVGSHVQPYINEPFGALQVVIDSSKDKVERIHAALGIIDFGAITFIPHDHDEELRFATGPADHQSKSEDDLCCELEEIIDQNRPAPKGGAKGADAKAIPWSVLLPLAIALLRKWLNF